MQYTIQYFQAKCLWLHKAGKIQLKPRNAEGSGGRTVTNGIRHVNFQILFPCKQFSYWYINIYIYLNRACLIIPYLNFLKHV